MNGDHISGRKTVLFEIVFLNSFFTFHFSFFIFYLFPFFSFFFLFFMIHFEHPITKPDLRRDVFIKE